MVRRLDWIHLAQDRDQWRALVNINEPSVSIKGGEFNWLSDYCLLKDCAPRS
jgi:hypothetical protein